MIDQLAAFVIADDHLILDQVALTLLLLSSLLVIRSRDLLTSAVLLGIFSLLMAVCYLLFDAPDVALTEAAVGAGISTILFIGTLSFTGRIQRRASISRRLTALFVTGVTAAALIISTSELPPFASPDAPIHQHVAPYYLEHTQEDIGIPNFVTAILASYRGFDTLGEVAVIFTAGIGITALLMNLPLTRRTAPAAPSTPQPAPAQPAATPAPRKAATKKTATKKPAAKKAPAKRKPASRPSKGGNTA